MTITAISIRTLTQCAAIYVGQVHTIHGNIFAVGKRKLSCWEMCRRMQRLAEKIFSFIDFRVDFLAPSQMRKLGAISADQCTEP